MRGNGSLNMNKQKCRKLEHLIVQLVYLDQKKFYKLVLVYYIIFTVYNEGRLNKLEAISSLRKIQRVEIQLVHWTAPQAR